MENNLNGAMKSMSINSGSAAAAPIVNGCCRGSECIYNGKLSCYSQIQQQQLGGCNDESNNTSSSSTLSNSQNNGHCVACKCSERDSNVGAGGAIRNGSSSIQSIDETDKAHIVGIGGNSAISSSSSSSIANIISHKSSSSASNTAQQHQHQQLAQQFQLQHQQEQQLLASQSSLPPYANATNAEKQKMVHELCQQLILTDAQIRELNYRILHEIKRGLCKDTHHKADVKCWVTYVQDLPNGNERGKFLALDLGGTNFRVLLIHLKEEHDFQMESRIYAIPQHIMIGTGEQLFDHIAECLASFMSEHNVYKEKLPLGFTFSFPLQQLGLTRGHLSTWTKGFNCSGVVGEDVVQLLKDAIARRGDVQIEICAILNDTTGTLMSCAWKNHNCKIGLIVGTGSNACYVERVEECELFEGAANGKSHMLINTEWGALGNNGMLEFLRTEFDDEIDKHSINPGKQLFEKMISGMYMGELVRLVIVKLVKEGILFKGQDSDVLMTRGQFFTKYVSEIEADEPDNFTNCRMVLDELGMNDATDEDCANVRYVCECVSKRAAHLVSCGIATLINKMDEKQVTVGVDGSVYRFHPKFHTLMVEKITELVKPGISFDLMLSEDGSGRGAALVAAVACREDNVKAKAK